MKRSYAVLLLAGATVFVAAGAGLRSPAARVLEVKGKATILDLENFDRPAAMYGTLYCDDRLVIDKNGSAVLVFRADGHIERLTAPGTFRVTQSGCQPRTGIEDVAVPERSQSLVGKVSRGPKGIVQGGVTLVRAPPPPGAPRDNSKPAKPMGTPRISPIPESTVLAVKPTFSWPEVPKAETYALKLYFLGNQTWSVTTNTTSLQYAGDAPLKAGAKYTWEVTTNLDGKASSVCEGIFSTATDAQRADAAAFEQLLAKPEVPFLALAALWYKQHGFLVEAIAANEQLAKLTADPAVYYTLAELYQQAGRIKDADAAADKAMELEAKAQEKVDSKPRARPRRRKS
jgi:hypothetical protein